MRVIYYSDELNDDFCKRKMKNRKLPEDYQYFRKSRLYQVWSFLLYRLLAVPAGYLYQKIVYREKIVNRKVLRPWRKGGYFLYGNHTRMAGDAFTPSLITFPKKSYILSNPDSVSIPLIGWLTQHLGCVPLPTSLHGMKRFHEAVLEHGRKKHAVVIYPEAHIWPYYTGIRPFRSNAFRYPAELHKPVFTFTVTYQKRKLLKHPKTVVYVDGPFWPKPDASVRQNQNYLRNMALNAMQERSRNSDAEYIWYQKVSEVS